MDYQSFVDGRKNFLIAPAGYGKTYTIVECLKYTSGKQLILTHTHAGVAVIKERIKRNEIKPEKFSVETISSFAQKFVTSYLLPESLPDQDSKEYHQSVINNAIELFDSPIVKRVLKNSYSGLFVDEYQDCTVPQHGLILKFSEILPTHILGDPLQAIFDFNEPCVDINSLESKGFVKFPDLDIPHRWNSEGNNESLGNLLQQFRANLNSGQSIDLPTENKDGIYFFQVADGDLNKSQSSFKKTLTRLISNNKNNADFENLLIIVPTYIEEGSSVKKGSITDRAKILTKVDYTKSVWLLEAIDDRTFYSLAKSIDDLLIALPTATKPVKKIHNIFTGIFLKTSNKQFKNSGLNDWFTTSGTEDYTVKSKQGELKSKSELLKTLVDAILSSPSLDKLSQLLDFLKFDLKLRKSRRIELLSMISKCLKTSFSENTSVYEAMKLHKNVVRRVGRKIDGKCIGTTLLTKGLEFDTVAVLDAHKFDCPKNLYVALTRGSKNLVIFSAESTLTPYKATS